MSEISSPQLRIVAQFRGQFPFFDPFEEGAVVYQQKVSLQNVLYKP
jgi:hypothetical protein